MKRIRNLLSSIDKREAANFGLFSLGKFISVFGSSVCTFAIGLFVLEQTGSGLSFAIAVVLGFVPIVIFAPIGGVLADRVSKKTVVVVCDALNGVLFILLYLVTMGSTPSLWLIYLGAFLTASLTTIFRGSLEAAKPDLVSDDKLIHINSVSKIIDSASAILGPIVGGMVFALIGLPVFLLVNGISFIISAALEMGIDFKLNMAEKREVIEESSFKKDIKAAFKYMMGRKDIVRVVVILIAINLFLSFSVTVPAPYIINVVYDLSSYQFGIIEGAFPVGLIIGALFVKKVMDKIESDRLIIITSMTLCACMILLAVPLMLPINALPKVFVFVYHMVLMGLFGLVISFIDIPVMCRLQQTVPEYIRGRVLSLAMGVVKIVSPVALLVSGVLLGSIYTWIIVIVGGVLLFAVNMIAIKAKTTVALQTKEA